MSNTVYWTMKDGNKISVDNMDINHLRNTLKMIIRNSERKPKKVVKPFEVRVHGEMASEHADLSVLHSISPELTCTCDSVHVCQQCSIEGTSHMNMPEWYEFM